MTKPADLSLLLRKRQLLYKKLLDCSSQQVGLLKRSEEEDFLVLFNQTSQEWNNFVDQIEKIQGELDTDFANEDHDPTSLVEISQNISNTIDIIESSLRESEMDVEADMNSVNTQKKIMNAYYGAHFSDSSSVYFDEKK